MTQSDARAAAEALFRQPGAADPVRQPAIGSKTVHIVPPSQREQQRRNFKPKHLASAPLDRVTDNGKTYALRSAEISPGNYRTVGRVFCGSCDAFHDVNVQAYNGVAKDKHVMMKTEQAGWSLRHGRWECGPCTRQRVDAGKGEKVEKAIAAPAIPVTRRKQAEIAAMLDTFWDNESKSYLLGMSDEKIAKKCECTPADVARVRKADPAEILANSDLSRDVKQIEQELSATMSRMAQLFEDFAATETIVQGLQLQLSTAQKALQFADDSPETSEAALAAE